MTTSLTKYERGYCWANEDWAISLPFGLSGASFASRHFREAEESSSGMTKFMHWTIGVLEMMPLVGLCAARIESSAIGYLYPHIALLKKMLVALEEQDESLVTSLDAELSNLPNYHSHARHIDLIEGRRGAHPSRLAKLRQELFDYALFENDFQLASRLIALGANVVNANSIRSSAEIFRGSERFCSLFELLLSFYQNSPREVLDQINFLIDNGMQVEFAVVEKLISWEESRVDGERNAFRPIRISSSYQPIIALLKTQRAVIEPMIRWLAEYTPVALGDGFFTGTDVLKLQICCDFLRHHQISGSRIPQQWLQAAVHYSDGPSLILLLNMGCSPNVQDENGWAPLHNARTESIVNKLVEAGADVRKRRAVREGTSLPQGYEIAFTTPLCVLFVEYLRWINQPNASLLSCLYRAMNALVAHGARIEELFPNLSPFASFDDILPDVTKQVRRLWRTQMAGTSEPSRPFDEALLRKREVEQFLRLLFCKWRTYAVFRARRADPSSRSWSTHVNEAFPMGAMIVRVEEAEDEPPFVISTE